MGGNDTAMQEKTRKPLTMIALVLSTTAGKTIYISKKKNKSNKDSGPCTTFHLADTFYFLY